MTWNQVGQYAITDIETVLSTSFTSRLALTVSDVSLLKPTWYWAGYFIQYLDIPDFGLARIEQKHNLSIREPSLFVPSVFQPSYKLKFYKADWINSLTLTILEDSMPITTTNESAIFPNPVASASTGTTVPVSATSVTLLAANTARKKYMIENNSNQDLYIDFGATSSVANHGQKIAKVQANGAISTWFDDDYTGVISGIWAAAGSGAALIREFT